MGIRNKIQEYISKGLYYGTYSIELVSRVVVLLRNRDIVFTKIKVNNYNLGFEQI